MCLWGKIKFVVVVVVVVVVEIQSTLRLIKSLNREKTLATTGYVQESMLS